MDTIIKPIITEQSMNSAALGKYTFALDKALNKNEIKRIIEDRFSVKVVSVATSIVKGKRQRRGAKRIEVRLPAWKKATVALSQGQKIDLFEAVA